MKDYFATVVSCNEWAVKKNHIIFIVFDHLISFSQSFETNLNCQTSVQPGADNSDYTITLVTSG